MQFHEAIYTSAPELLDGHARSDLGIVTRSRGFPRELDGELEVNQSYAILPGLSIHDPPAHPPRFLLGHDKGNRYFYLSRTVFAGSDHTGRTSPLAHHLVFKIEDMVTASLSPAALLGSAESVLRHNWAEPPVVIDPPRQLTNPQAPERRREYPSNYWPTMPDVKSRALLLAAAGECLLAFHHTQRRLVVCIPVALALTVGQLLADLLTLVPLECQLELGCATHVVEMADCPPEAAVVFTYPGTPYFTEQANRVDAKAPLLLDLTTACDRALSPLGNYGQVLADVLESPPCAEQLARARDLAPLWERAPHDAELCLAIWRYYQAIENIDSVEALRGLAKETRRICSASPQVEEFVIEWVKSLLVHPMGRFSSTKQWEALAAVANAPEWPKPLRHLALTRIVQLAREALAATAMQPGSSATAPWHVCLRQVLGQNRSLVADVLRKAIASGTKGKGDATKWAELAALSVDLAPSVTDEDLIQWTLICLAASEPIRQALLDRIMTRLARSPAAMEPGWLDQLGEVAHDSLETNASFRRDVFMTLVHRMMDNPSRPEALWQEDAAVLVRVALLDGSAPEEIAWLQSTYRDRINDVVLQQWKQGAQVLGRHDALVAVLREIDLEREPEQQQESWQDPPPLGPLKAVRRKLPSKKVPRGIPTSTIVVWGLVVCSISLLPIPWLLEWSHAATASENTTTLSKIQGYIGKMGIGEGYLSPTYAIVATVIAIIVCIGGEIWLARPRSAHLLRYTRAVRWLIIGLLVAAVGLSCYQIVDMVWLSLGRTIP